MPFAWKPLPGQVALIELQTGGNDCLTGIVVEGDGGPVVIDLGASPRPALTAGGECEVVASFFAPDALYRLRATLAPHAGGRAAIIDLRIHDIERVQRRSAPRARVALAIVLSNFDDPGGDAAGSFTSVVGTSIDVGEGGCRVVTARPFPTGCDPTVTLQLPTGEAVVALSAILQADHTDEGHEYRLVFLELEDTDRLRLAELVDQMAGASA